MLTTLHLENFKGISDRQRIDFAPLTLLFGPNSAGKSTILQSLLYLHELIAHGEADVDRTELGGTVIELGGFARLVHRHETHRSIVLRAEISTPGSLERFGRDLTHFPFPDLDDEIESAWLELTVRMRTTAVFHGPMIDQVVIGVGSSNEPLVWLDSGASLREGEPLYARINLGHPLLSGVDPQVVEAWEKVAIPEQVLLSAKSPAEPEDLDQEPGQDPDEVIEPHARLGLDSDRPLPVIALSRSRRSALPPVDEPLRVIAPFGDEGDDEAAIHEIRTFLEMVVLGTTGQLVASLKSSLYLGPLRTVPPRGFLFERAGRITSWGDGLAAWDLLLADRSDLVRRTNDWLTRLGAGCTVVVQELFDPKAAAEDLTAGNVDRTTRRLLLQTSTGSLVLPSEVGAGISQVLPVIVAALHARSGLIEQPELHVHPAVQVGLGDLFIEAAIGDGGRHPMLVETHSEHLMLRVLRRIRQTTDGELPEGIARFSNDQLSVSYVENGPYGVRIYRLRVDEDGDFEDRWPNGFFGERAEELL